MEGIYITGNESDVFEIGTALSDGSIYAGISPGTGLPLFTTPEDAAEAMTWTEAIEYAARLSAHGHNRWRLPTLGELDLLYESRAVIGNFHTSGEHHDGWYWSVDEDFGECAWIRHFHTGAYHLDTTDARHRLRCVRP